MGVDNPAGQVFGKGGFVAAHPGLKQATAVLAVKQAPVDPDVQGVMRNPVYPKEYVLSVHPKHVPTAKVCLRSVLAHVYIAGIVCTP